MSKTLMKKKSVSVLVIGGMIGVIVAMEGGLVGGAIVYADDDNVSISVPVACTMRTSGTNSHTAEVNNGTYEDEIGTTTLTALCNDNAGFSIYAVGFTGDEIGGTNSTKLVGSNTGSLIATGTATGSNASDPSNWAMKLETDSNATYPVTLQNGFGSYSAVPASYTKVATRLSSTDIGTVATGSTVTTTYAAYVNSEQASDAYIGKVKYTLVHPASEVPAQPQATASGKICYYANASSAEGTMGCQSISASATTATLLASNFSRTGYGFAGWSDAYDYATNNSANFYGPNETISFTAGQYTGTNNGLALYAVWVKSAGNIQSWSGCNSLASGAVTALTDQRDDETYAVAKLADGNCWMIENLRLESTAAHNSDGALAQGYGTSTTYGNFSGLADAEPAWANNITTANSLYYSGTQDGTATIDIGTGSNPGYRFPRYNHDNTNSRASSPTTNSVAMYSYGNYYAWHAAIADLNPNTTNNQSTTGTSLCPTGWHLPTGGGAYASDSATEVNKTGYPATYREFYDLGYKIMNEVKTAYEDTPNGYNSYYSSATTNTAGDTATKAFRKYPNNFVYSGYVSGGSVTSRGSNGNYWSSTADSSNGAYVLGLGSSNVYPGTDGYRKYYGRTVRCVAPGT